MDIKEVITLIIDNVKTITQASICRKAQVQRPQFNTYLRQNGTLSEDSLAKIAKTILEEVAKQKEAGIIFVKEFSELFLVLQQFVLEQESNYPFKHNAPYVKVFKNSKPKNTDMVYSKAGKTFFSEAREKYLKTIFNLTEELRIKTPTELRDWFENQFLPIFNGILFQKPNEQGFKEFIMWLSQFNTNHPVIFLSPYSELLKLIKQLQANWQDFLQVKVIDIPQITKDGVCIIDPNDKIVEICIY